GSRLSAYVGGTVGELGFLRGFWMDGSRRLAWLEDYAASLTATADLHAPAVLEHGIRLDRVSFAYPGTARLALDAVSLALPAGAVDVSFGQWQKLALARGFMRDRPLLLVLDEPTAALDAETEHALFERYAAAARDERADGRITILVSHRFSTVRMADIIVVMD